MKPMGWPPARSGTILRLGEKRAPGPYASESATAVIKWTQSGKPEDSQTLETIILKQVWARDLGLNNRIKIDG